jgi:hypothetical protein
MQRKLLTVLDVAASDGADQLLLRGDGLSFAVVPADCYGSSRKRVCV